MMMMSFSYLIVSCLHSCNANVGPYGGTSSTSVSNRAELGQAEPNRGTSSTSTALLTYYNNVYKVGVKSKTAKVQSKSGNVIYVDVKKNQVKSLSIPHFPQNKELYAALTPYHAQLVGESYLGFYGKRDRFMNAQMCRSSAPPFKSSDTRSTWSHKGATRESKSGRHGSTAWIKATRRYSHLRLMFST